MCKLNSAKAPFGLLELLGSKLYIFPDTYSIADALLPSTSDVINTPLKRDKSKKLLKTKILSTRNYFAL